MLDTNLFRTDKGRVSKTEVVRESQRRRLADVSLVDQVTLLYRQWSTSKYEFEQTRKGINELKEKIKTLKIGNLDATEAIKESDDFKKVSAAKNIEFKSVEKELDARLALIGNIVHDSVPVDNDEANNSIVRTSEECRSEANLINHVDLVNLLQIADLEKGSTVDGDGGFYLREGSYLHIALINYGLAFLHRKYESIQTPSFIEKEIMTRCAQSSQFDKELCKLVGDDASEKYLISSSEQPLLAFHLDKRIYPERLPMRYAGTSTCFLKEDRSYGRDSLGLLGVHQYDEVSQFCITSPHDNKSWEMHEEMIRNAEDFYKSLGIPYRVVNVVSGALSHAAAKTYKIEGWFPASQKYVELSSCSNYTDFMARSLGNSYGQKDDKQPKQKDDKQPKQFVHMLYCPLMATHKTICCILENYQNKDGVVVPEVLRPFMLGKDFFPFKK